MLDFRMEETPKAHPRSASTYIGPCSTPTRRRASLISVPSMVSTAAARSSLTIAADKGRARSQQHDEERGGEGGTTTDWRLCVRQLGRAHLPATSESHLPHGWCRVGYEAHDVTNISLGAQSGSNIEVLVLGSNRVDRDDRVSSSLRGMLGNTTLLLTAAKRKKLENVMLSVLNEYMDRSFDINCWFRSSSRAKGRFNKQIVGPCFSQSTDQMVHGK